MTFRDFLTDGSVAALCDELAHLSGVPIWLRDQVGDAIVPEWSHDEATAADGTAAAAGHPWSIVPEEQARRRAFALVSRAPDAPYELFAVPLRIRAGLLGSLAAALPPVRDVSDAARHGGVRRALALLASSVSDVCEAQWTLRKRVRELDALYRLSALVSDAGSIDRLLELILELTMQVLEADAGSIAVIEDRSALYTGAPPSPGAQPLPLRDGWFATIRAARGLSDRWLNESRPLSRDGVLREAALAGGLVSVEDLWSDPRVAEPDRARDEGLRSLLSTGLLDRGAPIGLIRLYTRAPRLFTQAEGELLVAIAESAATAIANARLRGLRAQDEAVNRQVRLAAAVQRRMLPRAMPQMPPFDVAAHYAPSFDLGGDFYDFLELGGNLGVLIGDVVGKGVPAALLMSAVRAALRAHAEAVYHIDEVFVRVNRDLARDTLDNEFATVWYGVADPQTLRLTYCGAGHDWPLLVRVPKDRPVEEKDVLRLTADGMALGIDPNQKYPKGLFQLQPGDVLLAYTDGLHDATNFEGRRFGGTRLRRALVDLLAREPHATAARVVEYVMAHVRQHTGLSGRGDDITVVVMRVGEKRGK